MSTILLILAVSMIGVLLILLMAFGVVIEEELQKNSINGSYHKKNGVVYSDDRQVKYIISSYYNEISKQIEKSILDKIMGLDSIKMALPFSSAETEDPFKLEEMIKREDLIKLFEGEG